jgi:hypothetical protein
MQPFDAEPVDRQVRGWSTPAEALVEAREARPPASYCYLLDVDKDLADEFDLRMRIVVRRVASVLVFDAPVGRCDLRSWFDPAPDALGLLVLDGVIAFDVYALATVIARVPRLRIHLSTQRAEAFLRVSVISALALNWIYLLLHWRNF